MFSFISKLEARWFGIAILLSLSVIGLYIVLHQQLHGESNWKYLSKEQLSVAISLMDNDSIAEDSLKQNLLLYLNLIFELQNESDLDLAGNSPKPFYKEAINQFSAEELKIVLPTVPFRVKSIFWLCGNKVFLEIIFWALFGLVASILFRVTEAIRNQDFHAKRIPIHLGKIIYAPLSAIVIIFSIDVLASDNGNAFESIDHGVIVLSFILGFYSGRTIELLRRIKDLLLPLGEDTETARKGDGRMYKVKGKLLVSNEVKPVKKEFWRQAEVYAESMENHNIKKTTAHVNDKGNFEFPFLYEGRYIILAELKTEKYWFQKKQFVEVNEEVEKKDTTIFLNEFHHVKDSKSFRA